MTRLEWILRHPDLCDDDMIVALHILNTQTQGRVVNIEDLAEIRGELISGIEESIRTFRELEFMYSVPVARNNSERVFCFNQLNGLVIARLDLEVEELAPGADPKLYPVLVEELPVEEETNWSCLRADRSISKDKRNEK